MFADTGYSAVENSPTLGYVPCGPYIWTGASGGANITTGPYIFDSRSSAINNEPGNVWISWNVAAQPSGTNVPTKVCAFISVDSAVGVRAAMANPSASLIIPSNLTGAADAGKLTALPSNAVIMMLPTVVCRPTFRPCLTAASRSRWLPPTSVRKTPSSPPSAPLRLWAGR